MTQDDLLPCPFCGWPPVTERTGFSLRAMNVYCINDNGCPRPKAVGETEEKAVENWNLRDPEIERLRTENWQLKQALGYPIPADRDTPQNPFKCGICDARAQEQIT